MNRSRTFVAVSLAVVLSLALFGCVPATEEVEMFGQTYQVEKGKEVVVEVKASNLVSTLDGYVYPDSMTELKGTTASLSDKARIYREQELKVFPDAKIEVLSVDGKEV